MHGRSRSVARAALALVVVASLGGVATGDSPFETWAEGFSNAVSKIWPAQTTGDRIHELPDDVAARLTQVKERLRDAKDLGLTAEQVRHYGECVTDLEGLRGTLAAVLPSLGEAHLATQDLLALEKDTVARLGDVVRDVSGKQEDVVVKAFVEVKRDVDAYEGSFRKKLAKTQAALGKGTSWRAGTALFAPLDTALDRRVQQVAAALDDTVARVFETSKGMQAAQAGEKTILVELCIAGATAEALEYLRSWSPPRLVFALGIRDPFAFPAEAGWVDVVAHGDPKSVDIELRGIGTIDADAETVFAAVKYRVKPEDIARWRKLNDDMNTGLRLISCKTGASWTGIAQQLANLTGVPVKAPTDTLWLISKGGEVHGIIHSCSECRGQSKSSWVYNHIFSSTQRGVWRTFSPQGDEADRKVRDRLLDLAEKEPWWQITVTDVTPLPDPKEAAKRLDALQRLGAKQSDKDLAALLASGKDFVLIARLTRDAARVKSVDVGRLGLKCKGDIMPVHKAKFTDVKLD